MPKCELELEEVAATTSLNFMLLSSTSFLVRTAVPLEFEHSELKRFVLPTILQKTLFAGLS